MTISSPQIRHLAGNKMINEAGLYLHLLTAQTDVGRQVREWLSSEVIPAIVKTGGYLLAAVSPHSQQRGRRSYIPGSKTKSPAVAAEQTSRWIVEELMPTIVRTGGYCLKGRSLHRCEVGSHEEVPLPTGLLDILYDDTVYA